MILNHIPPFHCKDATNARFRKVNFSANPAYRQAGFASWRLRVKCISSLKRNTKTTHTEKVAELTAFSIGFPLAISVNNFSNRLKL